MKFYILTETHEIAEADIAEYAEFRIRDGHIVDRTETALHVISTVFLGQDHDYSGKGPPLWFETMSFDKEGGATGDQWRFPTWKDAKAGHRAIVRLTLQAEAEAAEVVKKGLL